MEKVINKKIFFFLVLSVLTTQATVASNKKSPSKKTTQKTNKEMTNKVAQAHFDLGKAYQEEKNIEEAIINLQKALDRDPKHLSTLFLLGKIYLENKKEYNKAIEYFKKKLKLNPKCYKSECSLANAYYNKKNTDLAIAHYKKSIAINQKYIPAYEGLANALIRKKKMEYATDIYLQALEQAPRSVETINKLIDLLIKQKRFDEAADYCKKSIKIKDDDNNQAKVSQLFSFCNHHEEALKILQKLHKKHPENDKIANSLAYSYKQTGDCEKNIDFLKTALELNPKNKSAQINLAHSLLSIGDFANGWTRFYNYKTKKSNTRLGNKKGIKGRAVLIQGEWNLKDNIMFLRYIKEVKKLGAKKIIVQTPQSLIPILERCPDIDQIINMNKATPCSYNKKIPLTCLPKIFETTVETIPNETPYIDVDQKIVNQWKERLQHDTALKIGVYNAKNSSIPMAHIMRLSATENTSTYILRGKIDHQDLHTIPNSKMVHLFGKGFEGTDTDIVNLSAIIKNMNLVITNDSFVAHLAGALGAPVWVMLPYITDWRWLRDRANSPWYPTMKLFRQKKEDKDWDAVIDAMIKELEKIATQ